MCWYVDHLLLHVDSVINTESKDPQHTHRVRLRDFHTDHEGREEAMSGFNGEYFSAVRL